MMQQYLLPKQRDTVLANINTSLRPVTSSNSETTSQSTTVSVNNNSMANNAPSKGSGINRMSCKFLNYYHDSSINVGV